MKYIITKDQCQSKIDKMQPVVCKGCGGKIEPIKTVDNANNPTYWTGCLNCQCFDNGTNPKIYNIAKRLIDERNFWYYHHDEKPDKKNEPEMFDYWRKSQIKGTVGLVENVIKFHKDIK